jgi:hypothetical protein
MGVKSEQLLAILVETLLLITTSIHSTGAGLMLYIQNTRCIFLPSFLFIAFSSVLINHLYLKHWRV